jgi:hypothetical protein
MRVNRERVNGEPADAPPARRARELTGDGSAGVLRLQRAAGNRAVTRLLARAPRTDERTPAVPWRGEVAASWNAALRRRPNKDPDNPHDGILADLERGTEVIVVGQERGWLRAEVTVGGKKLAGYISHELVRHLGPVVQAPPPIDLSEPLDLDLGVFGSSGAFVALKRAANRRVAIPDWEPTKEERGDLDRAADTLENTGRYVVDRSTFVVSFAPSSSGGKLTVTTIDDFILFVEAIENEYPQATPGEVAGEIRQIQFSGGNWETLLNSPGISESGRAVDIENPANPIAKRFDIPALKANHKLATADGEVDVLHVVSGIDAALNGAPTKPVSDEQEDQLKFKTMTAAHGGDPRDFATWSGDLGQAYADYLSARFVEGKKDAKLLRYMESAATPAELLGDIHGYIALNVFARTPPPVRTGWFLTGNDATVSNVLRTLYQVRKKGTAGAATYQSLFEEVSGKPGGDLKSFVTARALAFARIWYVKNAKAARGTVGSAKHAGSIDKAEILEGLLKEFDALHADNERDAAAEDRIAEVIGRFLPMLGGSTD